MSMFKLALVVPALVLLTCLAGCGSGQTLHVTTIQLGRALNPDATVASFTTRFAPDESVYLSVLTGGAGSATISVRWTYAGRVIDEPKKQVSYRMDAATEFRLQSTTGFPEGDYTAEVFVNGQTAGTRTFRVEKAR
jgi:hypothetical protein